MVRPAEIKPHPNSDRTAIQSLSVLCEIAHVVETLKGELFRLGFHVDRAASTKIVLDLPVTYGLKVLERLKNDHGQIIMVTWNPCKEHMEDLWDLEPNALLEGELLEKQGLDRTLSEVMDRLSAGQRYRLTPGPPTSLTRCERLVLRYIAQGEANQHVARRLHIKEQTVKNTLRSVYRKLDVCNHVQAALYYWGVLSLEGASQTHTLSLLPERRATAHPVRTPRSHQAPR